MDKERAALINATLRSIEGLYKSRRGSSPGEWLEVDLTMPQLKVLFFLYTDGPARVTEVAGSMGVTPPTATVLLDKLAERGLVSRKTGAADRRIVLCALTDAGFRLADSLWQVGRRRFRQLLERLSAEELKLVDEALRTLHQAARNLEKETPVGT